MSRPIRKRYSHAIADKAKDKRREEAKERQQTRNQRSNKQQLAKLDTGGYAAKRERGKLGEKE